MFTNSFWADEAGIAAVSVQLILGKLSFMEALNALHYQRLHILVIASFFKLFGVSEFSARLPSLLFYLIGIITIFFLARKLSNVYGGILSSFLYAFSHLQLAYATQAKPYIAIEAILLGVLYLLIYKKKVNYVLIILLCVIATLFHDIGVFLWVIYFAYLIQTFKRSRVFVLIAICIAGVFILPIAATILSNGLPFKYNHIYQVMKLFVYKYSLVTLCSFFGFVWLAKKQKELSVSLVLYAIIVFIFVCFVGYIFNIRYVLSLFGILFLYFGIFWAKVGERFDKNLKFEILNFKLSGKAIIPITVMLLIYISGYKIVRGPQAYYNPNIDKYGDVQIANYKDLYALLKQKFPQYKELYVVNDTSDAEYWYFGRFSSDYFMKFTLIPRQHHIVKQAMIYGSLNDFKKMIKIHPQGLLIMEDWQSLLPDDIKEYAKKNLHLEFRVESLKEAPDDPWPLALYSWGFNNK